MRNKEHTMPKKKKTNKLHLLPFIILGVALIAVVIAIFKFNDDSSENANSSITGTVDESNDSGDSAASESSSEEASLSLADEEVYNLELMEANGIQPLDASQYDDMAAVIEATMADFGVDESQISLAYEDLQTGETYTVNPDQYLTAASTIKVPLSVLFVDAIEAGDMSWDTEIQYSYGSYEEGDGTITAGAANGTGQAAYTVEELIGEALMHSDNTATNMLISYYNNYYGTGAFRTNLFSIVDVVDEAAYSDNIASANALSTYYDLIASEDQYQPIIEFLQQTSPDRLFTTYVNTELMANKYGNYGTTLNDSGIYYEDDQPQYSLVVLTDGLAEGEAFIENLSLRVNEYYRDSYGE